ncbi:MAG: PAS domain-containing protein [Acidobacteria bacterium]|nr:PAS domain-containing protein [Acidobacteriota bacterium]
MLSLERRVMLTALLGGFPAAVTAALALWRWDAPADVRWPLLALAVGGWIGSAFALRRHISYPLRTLANLLAAIREGDYSLRMRTGRNDSLAEALHEANQLTETLRAQRIGAIEAAALLQKVMDEIDAAVFAFDEAGKLRLVNHAGERLLAGPATRLIGKTAEELDLTGCLAAEPGRAFDKVFPGGSGRWSARRSRFRENGRPHDLLALADLTRELREEELQAWQRLVRVLSHELNNSLAPIQSIAGSLADRVRRGVAQERDGADMIEGLGVIERRSEALGRFLSAYAKLARLPEPRLEAVDVAQLVERVAGVETRLRPSVEPGPPVEIAADPDQLEQALINLVRNGADAALETGGAVRLSWSAGHGLVEIRVEDEGPGLADDANLFVPFYTTKPDGAGVGLVLSRKIAERHGGALTLSNRDDGRGCVSRLQLPLAATASS